MLPNIQWTITFRPHYRTFFIRGRSLFDHVFDMYVLPGERLNELKNCSEMFYEVSPCQNIPRDSTRMRHIRRGGEIPNSGAIRIWI